MKIDLPVDLSSLNDITDGTFALYFHEYIHFLQDISTIYGLMNISTITYYIQDVAHRVGKQEEKTFYPPMPLINDGRDFGYTNYSLKPIYIGSPINPKRKHIKIISYNIEQTLWGSNAGEKIDVVKIVTTDSTSRETFNFNLGGNHITEGMAILCERQVYHELLTAQGHIFPVDEYPYLVAQQLAEIIYPELATQSILVVAVCDAALMTYHPGLNFIRLLEHLKGISFLDQAEEIKDLYVAAYNFFKNGHADFAVVLETVREQIKLNFKVDHFEGNNNWIDLLFDRIKAIRTKMPEFITDIISSGELKHNPFFASVHNLLGSPLVINGEDIGTFSLPQNFDNVNFYPHLFWAINQTLRIFLDKEPLPCELKEHCLKSESPENKIKVDHRCDSAPWSRCNDNDLCPFAVMWKHWALTTYVPVLNNKGGQIL